MLTMIMMVNPIYCPIVILRGFIVLLVDASAKKVAKTNMSSILVMANELHAVPIDFPNCMVASRAVTIVVFVTVSGLMISVFGC